MISPNKILLWGFAVTIVIVIVIYYCTRWDHDSTLGGVADAHANRLTVYNTTDTSKLVYIKGHSSWLVSAKAKACIDITVTPGDDLFVIVGEGHEDVVSHVNGIWISPTNQRSCSVWIGGVDSGWSAYPASAILVTPDAADAADAADDASESPRGAILERMISDVRYGNKFQPHSARHLMRTFGVNGHVLVARDGTYTQLVTPSGISLALVPSGSFVNERGNLCTVSRAYWVSRTEITVQQYCEVISYAGCTATSATNTPAVNITWTSASRWCDEAGARDGVPYRLLTEAEWELACRGKGGAAYSPMLAADSIMWSSENSGLRIQEVAGLHPNDWGLFDMHGNAREWCSDWFSITQPPQGNDPTGPAVGVERVRRGGSYESPGHWCLCHVRDSLPPDVFVEYGGFRVAVDSNALFSLSDIEHRYQGIHSVPNTASSKGSVTSSP